jgi:predicted porin
MKKLVIAALALSMVVGAALAQSSVKVYGVADAGLVLERGGPAGAVQGVGSGVASGSRIGIKGTEDLGGGLAASFVLENGYGIDTGAAGQGGLLFGRQAWVGLSGSAGKLSFGRQYSPYYRAINDIADPFCTGLAGSALNIFPSNSRVDNSVSYSTPQAAGWRAEMLYGMGEKAGNSEANRTIGASTTYERGPLTVVLVHHQREDATGDNQARNTMLVGRYKTGRWSGQLARSINRDVAGARSKDTLLGGTALFGVHKLLLSYIDHQDDTPVRRDAHQIALGYLYALSARTDLYTAYGHITNRNGATFKVGNATESGSGNAGLNLGIRHVF